MFDRPPAIAAGDRGFASATNEAAAIARGVRRVILPRPGRTTDARRAHERQRWFRRGQRWRVGCEGRISVIKRRHGLRRCRYRGADGTARWVGLGVIANNLRSTAAFMNKRATSSYTQMEIGRMQRPDSRPAARKRQTQALRGHFFTGK
jgi:IS5 family transposase